MLPRLERLKEKKLFNIAFTKKQRLTTGILSLYYLFFKKDINKLQKKQTIAKAAFIVGLRVDKRATRRNLIKRRMRAAYRLTVKNNINLDDNNLSALIWIANPSIKDATFEQIQNSMKNLLNKLRMLEKISPASKLTKKYY